MVRTAISINVYHTKLCNSGPFTYAFFTSCAQYLGIEFYLFVSHGGMNDRGSTCKFRNARSAFRNLHVDPLSFIPP